MAGLSGRQLGDFLVGEFLAQGGSGSVYLAEQVTLGREAIIKVLTDTDASESSRERFLREARLASKLEHPFAAHVYAFGAEPDGVLWIALELVRGVALDKLLARSGSIPLARFVPLFDKICDVVNAAHEQGIVHRDLKPGNVMVLQQGGRWFPKLLDLGIARATNQAALDDDEPAYPDQMAVTSSESIAGRLSRSESVHLTHAGSVVGTPHYMPPEQWFDAASADARSDVYALSILAWQCLMGRLPFEGKTLRAIGKAHASIPFPPLGDQFPPALSAVLQRGAAKAQADRYPSARELAEATRAAANVEPDDVTLPLLDEGIRANALARAPRPIAEAIAGLETARTPRQLATGLAIIAATLSRFWGAMALAGRVQVGPGGPESPRALELLHSLLTSSLNDSSWVQLAMALVEPFASKRDAYPVPDAVSTLRAHGPELISWLEAVSDLKGAPDDRLPDAVGPMLVALGRILEKSSTLFDYPTVVMRREGELWMGTRRAQPITQPLLGPMTQNSVFLTDELGAPVLQLTPFIQAFPPSGGAPDELFFLEGSGRHGARLVAWPTSFERHDSTLWSMLEKAGLSVSAVELSEKLERAPYKGLAPFSPDDADTYFGRESESEAFGNRLRTSRFLAVVGPSGTGKSSFILAGVLPLLPASWRPLVLRPGVTPLQSLDARLALEGVSVDSRQSALADVVAEVERSLGPERTLVVVVDQFEELVTLCHEPIERQRFSEVLLALAESATNRIRVVVTLRDDFLIQIQQLQPFRERLSSSLELLATPLDDQLMRVVTEPAKRAGYGFDDPNLPRRMVDEVREHPGALALLSFTASQLWELRDRHMRLMRAKTYEALGGVGGALAQHAEATLHALGLPQQKLVREAFRHLVTSQGTRSVLTRSEMMQLLGNGHDAMSVIERMVSARLLVSSERANGEDQIELVHEALVRAWPRLVAWQREDADSARLRDSLRASARQWADRGRPSGLLWRKETLVEYRLWRSRTSSNLTEVEAAFARSSLREEARARLFRRAAVLFTILGLTIGLALVFRAYRQADVSLQTLRTEQGRLALLDGKPLEASSYFAAAQPKAPTPAFRHMVQYAQWAARGKVGSVVGEGPLSRIALSPTDESVAAFGLVKGGLRFDFKSSLPIALPNGIGSYLSPTEVLVARDESTLQVLGGNDRTVDVGVTVRSVDGAVGGFAGLRTLGKGTAMVLENEKPKVVLSGQGAASLETTWARDKTQVRIISGQGDETAASFRGVATFDVAANTIVRLQAADSVIRTVEELGEAHLAVGTSGGEVRAYRIDTHPVWTTPLYHQVSGIRLSPNGQQLLVRAEGNLAVLSAHDGLPRWNREVSKESLQTAEWLSDDTIFVGKEDGTIDKIDAHTGLRQWSMVGPSDAVKDLAVLKSRTLIAAAASDGTLSFFDALTQAHERVLPPKVLGAWAVAWDPTTLVATPGGWLELETKRKLLEGQELKGDTATSARSSDGRLAALANLETLWLVDLKAPEKPLRTIRLDAVIWDVWFNPSGTLLAATLEDGRAALIDLANGDTRYVSHGESLLSRGMFSQDGSRLFLSSMSGKIQVFTLPGGEFDSELNAHSGYFEFKEGATPTTVMTCGYDGSVIEWDANLTRRNWKVSNMKAKQPAPYGATVKDGLLSVFFASGEWLVFEIETNTLLSRFILPFKVSYIGTPKGADHAFITTPEGALMRVPRWPTTPSISCPNPYQLEEGHLTIHRDRLACAPTNLEKERP